MISKDEICSIVASVAPEDQDDDAISYLCELLSDESDDGTPPRNEEDLLALIRTFFGEEHDEKSQLLAKTIVRLERENLQDGDRDGVGRKSPSSAADPETAPKLLDEAVSMSLAQQSKDDDIRGSESCANTVDDASKKNRRSQKRVRKKKTNRTKGRHATSSHEQTEDAGSIKTKSANEVEDLDDHSSAWAECRAESKTWGGRGHGGRGLRSMYASTSARVTDVNLQNVSMQFAGNDLLQNARIQISEGKRYGLIGRNGVGKSTLLRRLASKSISGFPIQMKVLLVQQQVEGTSKTALRTLLDADEDRLALLREQDQLEQIMDGADVSSRELAKAAERLSEVADELDAIGAENAEARAREILVGLQFTDRAIDSPTDRLSGGWKMRLSLAQALYVRSDLLLLDEPTNHLDLHAVVWLNDYLNKSDATLVLVSHDRAFLDDVCTDIIHFDHQKLKYHPGNFSAFERQRTEKAAREAQILDAADRKKKKSLEFIERQQQRRTVSKKRGGPDPNKQRQARMIKEKKLDRIGNYREDGKRYKNFSLQKLSEDYLRTSQQVEIEADDPVARFKLPDPVFPKSVKRDDDIFSLFDVSFAYGRSPDFVLNHVTLQIQPGSKVAVVGKNGSGKTSLLRIIDAEDSPTGYAVEGDVRRHPTVRVGKVAQHDVEGLDAHGNDSVVEYVGETLRHDPGGASVAGTTGSVRQYLGAYGLGGKLANRKIASLSGGERMRLCFAIVFATRPHILLLDEPTNHLDMERLDALALALASFQGAVVIVSHNQQFLTSFCNELWVVEDGAVIVKHGDSQTFDENFAVFKSETVAGVQGRSEARTAKAALAKQAGKQHKTPKTGGFIG